MKSVVKARPCPQSSSEWRSAEKTFPKCFPSAALAEDNIGKETEGRPGGTSSTVSLAIQTEHLDLFGLSCLLNRAPGIEPSAPPSMEHSSQEPDRSQPRPRHVEVTAASSLFASSSASSSERSKSAEPPGPTAFTPLTAPVGSSNSSVMGAPAGTLPNGAAHQHHHHHPSSILPRALPNMGSSGLQSPSLFPNISQPSLIPATRFDTVTSYVDVIYQQLQHSQSVSQRSQLLGQIPESSQVSANANEGVLAGDHCDYDVDNNIIFLSPSDGIDGDSSFMATCPSCTMMVMTETQPVFGKRSYKMACMLTPILMCCLPLSKIQLARRWMDVKHWCPQCHGLVAIYRKS